MASVIQRFDLPWMTGYTTNNDADGIIIPATPWRRIAGGTSARGWVEFSGEQGSAEIAVGFQKTNNVTTPGSGTQVCAFKSTIGVGDPDAAPTTVDLDGDKYIRAVYMLRSTDGVIAGGAFRGVVEILD